MNYATSNIRCFQNIGCLGAIGEDSTIEESKIDRMVYGLYGLTGKFNCELRITVRCATLGQYGIYATVKWIKM